MKSFETLKRPTQQGRKHALRRHGQPDPVDGFQGQQIARGDYFEDVENKDRSMPFYTYNWPYDFCSLIELAQPVSMDFKKIPDTRNRTKRVDLPDELALADRGAGFEGEVRF